MEKIKKGVNMKKKLRLLLFIISIVIFLLIIMNNISFATNNNEMNIYSINIGEGNKGDSTLVESNGEFLLMDIGVEESYPYIDKFLSENNITHFSLYFSHFHKDHTGGFKKEVTELPIYKLMEKYKIDYIYLPDPSLLQYKGKTIDENSDMYYRKLKKIYETSTNQTKNYEDIVVYLKKGSNFSLGSVNVSIIGPVGMDNYKSPLENESDSDGEQSITTYQNNCSLVAKLVCDKISFLTAGDLKTDGEKALINEYKDTNVLKSDIYKMSHHGLYPANSEEFIDCIRPDFSFASDYSYTNINTEGTGKYWRTYKAQMNCSKYGFTYMGGRENKTLHINISNNSVSLYKYGESKKLNSKGWTKVVGGDGTYRTYDYYYFDESGYTLKGVQIIDGKYYYLGTGGYRHYGRGKEKSYAGMVVCNEDNKKRYFSEKTDEMAVGFKKINGKKYYFDKKNGILATGLTKIENDYYIFSDHGTLLTSGISRTINGVKYTFNKKGKMTNVPKASKTSISKLKSSKKTITFNWNKKKVDGYKIYISSSKKGKYKCVSTIKKGSKTSVTIKKLKKNKKYYIKIKSYVKIGKYKEYSKYSKVKSIKTKKNSKAPGITCER